MKDVARFLSLGTYALAGASRDPKKFGNIMFRSLREKGMSLVPLNPLAETIDGVKCYNSVSDLPENIKGIIFLTPREETLGIAREAVSRGIKDLWIQNGAETGEAIEELQKEDINLIHHECMMMYWKPSGIHSFHRFLKKIFGGLAR